MQWTRRRVAFLFLGETLLIPHLWPIVEALSALDPSLPIDLWVSTSVQEKLLEVWSASLTNVHIRHAPGFRALDTKSYNPELPPKLPMLMALAPRLARTRVAVCAELTSLWLPTLLPMLPTRFVKAPHGAGSVQRRLDRRRRHAALTLVPSRNEQAEYAALGMAASRLDVVGYVKASFNRHAETRPTFPDRRPVLLYAPHWQRHRSSWWEWGRQIVAMLMAQERFNVVIAPHQRLVEGDPDAREIITEAGRLPHIHGDLDSFAMVDGTYTTMADLYLGDTSSQVLEFLATPRPCVFLNPQHTPWRGASDRLFWTAGEVVESLDRLPLALAEAPQRQSEFRNVQQRLAEQELGETGPEAPIRAARAILAQLDR